MKAAPTVVMIGLALRLLAAPLAGEAEPSAKIYKLEFLMAMDPQPGWQAAFKQGLQAFGWSEGQNIAFEYRSADGYFERLPGLCAELASLGVDGSWWFRPQKRPQPSNARAPSRLSSPFTAIRRNRRCREPRTSGRKRHGHVANAG